MSTATPDSFPPFPPVLCIIPHTFPAYALLCNQDISCRQKKKKNEACLLIQSASLHLNWRVKTIYTEGNYWEADPDPYHFFLAVLHVCSFLPPFFFGGLFQFVGSFMLVFPYEMHTSLSSQMCAFLPLCVWDCSQHFLQACLAGLAWFAFWEVFISLSVLRHEHQIRWSRLTVLCFQGLKYIMPHFPAF